MSQTGTPFRRTTRTTGRRSAMASTNQAAELFEVHRGYLTAVAYRMLGTLADAEDAVQEAYLRFAGADLDDLREPRGWLTTVLSRICLDHLGSAQVRRE